MLDNFELRLGWDFQQLTTKQNGEEKPDLKSGFTPLLVGFKVGVTQEQGLLPHIAVIGHLFLPFSAGADYKPDTTGGELLLGFSSTLNEQSSLGYSFGATWGDDSSVVNYTYTFSYNRNFTDDLGVFAELYGALPENSKGQNSWDAGLTYLINNDLQVDASVGSGFDTDQCILLSAGISYRFRSL